MTSVCGEPGCPNLKPCPVHTKDTNATRNPQRNRAAHARWARAVKQRDGYKCRNCGSKTKLDAHHVRPGYRLQDGITLCNACHTIIDSYARKR